MIPKIALDYIENKKLTPGFSYKDVWREEHTTGFTVAKAMQLDVLSDLHNAVTKSIENGQSFDTFKKDIEPLLHQKGWWGKKEMIDPITGKKVQAQLGSNRRLKTIYHVNMRSAYQKGQYDRAMESEMHPYFLYRIGPSANHREQHVLWDGLILPKDDPFWDAHFPPNGWGCKCYTRAITEARKKKYEQTGISVPPRADGTGGGTLPAKTKAPPDKFITYFNERKGTIEKVPEGIDPAFNWNIGKSKPGTAAARKLADAQKNYKAAVTAKPKKDIAETLLENLGVKTIKLPGISDNVKMNIANTLKSVYDKIPEAKGVIDTITINNRLKKVFAQCVTYLNKIDDSSKIELAGKYYKDAERLKTLYEKSVKTGFHVQGTDWQSILTHELGHAIHSYIIKQNNIDYYSFANNLRNEVLVELGLQKSDVELGLSRYAQQKSTEFIAEGFVEFIHSSTPRPIAKKIGEKLVKYLRSKK
jgi:hypothetical protein